MPRESRTMRRPQSVHVATLPMFLLLAATAAPVSEPRDLIQGGCRLQRTKSRTSTRSLRFRPERTRTLVGAAPGRDGNNLGSNVSTRRGENRDNEPGYSLFCKETAIKPLKALSPPFHVTDH